MEEEGSDSRLFKIADHDEVMSPVTEDDERRAKEEAMVSAISTLRWHSEDNTF